MKQQQQQQSVFMQGTSLAHPHAARVLHQVYLGSYILLHRHIVVRLEGAMQVEMTSSRPDFKTFLLHQSIALVVTFFFSAPLVIFHNWGTTTSRPVDTGQKASKRLAPHGIASCTQSLGAERFVVIQYASSISQAAREKDRFQRSCCILNFNEMYNKKYSKSWCHMIS